MIEILKSTLWMFEPIWELLTILALSGATGFYVFKWLEKK